MDLFIIHGNKNRYTNNSPRSWAACLAGRPQEFEDSLERRGCLNVIELRYRIHDQYNRGSIPGSGTFLLSTASRPPWDLPNSQPICPFRENKAAVASKRLLLPSRNWNTWSSTSTSALHGDDHFTFTSPKFQSTVFAVLSLCILTITVSCCL